MQAHHHKVTELTIGAAAASKTMITETITDFDISVYSVPPGVRTKLVNALNDASALPVGPFPKEGTIVVQLETKQLTWKVKMMSPKGEIVFTPVVEK